MNASSISQYISSTFADIHPVAAWGETSFFYNPGRKLPRGIYFATLKDKDGDNDRASNLQRQAVFRLNIRNKGSDPLVAFSRSELLALLAQHS